MTRSISFFAAVICASTVLTALPAVSQPESILGSPAEGAFRAATAGSSLALIWPQMVAVQAKYLPHCQDARLLAEVSALIERETSLHVLKITHEVVFATTIKGFEVARLVQNQMSVEDSIGAHLSGVTLPICLATVITNHGDQTWGYGWEVTDGQAFVTAQSWNGDQSSVPAPQPSNVCAQSKALGGSFYATGGNGGYDDRRGVCWTERCAQQYRAPRCY